MARCDRKKGGGSDRSPKEKRSFFQKLQRRFSEMLDLGKILVNKPREFPAALSLLIKRFVRNLWDARGGGLYACGFIIFWVWLEIQMMIDDIVNFDGLAGLFSGQIMRFVFRFAMDSLINSIHAFMWPVAVIELYPPWGLVALVALFFIFPKTLKPPLERWLFDDDEENKSAD